MLTQNQKSKMICDVKKLKEYFDKRFNELKNSLDVNNTTLENFKSEIKSDLQKLENKIDNKIKVLESDKKLLQQQITALAQQIGPVADCALGLIVFLNRIMKIFEDVLKFIEGRIEEIPDLEIPEAVIEKHIELVLMIPTKKRVSMKIEKKTQGIITAETSVIKLDDFCLFR